MLTKQKDSGYPANLQVCDEEYEELINKKVETIYIDDDETRQDLKGLIKRKKNMNANIIEIDEAICFGERPWIP